MERDNLGKPLVKIGFCKTCGKSGSVLVDEDFECCEEVANEEIYKPYEPSRKLVTSENFKKITFSVMDMILAMTGRGWKSFKALREDLESVGFDYVMMIDDETLIYIIEQLEGDEFIEVNWDGEYLKRIDKEW